ncbi:hypothetical protein EXS74_03360 [Candidatus Woesearchaeota archaeon]|nr:hypothetical protein [Candidatus Woesearchaeota archaeon]
MKQRIKELGLAGLGLGVTIKEKVQGLVRKGKANEKVLKGPRQKLAAGAHLAGKEALVISKKSLQMLERELKKLEAEAKKSVKKGIAKRRAKSSPKKRR